MKQAVKVAIVFIVLFLLVFLVSAIIIKANNKRLITEKIKMLPDFTFRTLKDSLFNSSDITNGPVLIVRFHPECEHCQFEMPQILNSKIPSSVNLIIMISSANADSLRKFFIQLNIDRYPQVIPLIDTTYQFGDIFGSDISPSIFIYDKELKLIKVFYGEVKTEAILNILNQNGSY